MPVPRLIRIGDRVDSMRGWAARLGIPARQVVEVDGAKEVPWEAKIRHPLYFRWEQMIKRCEDKRNPSYPDYGGRGIRVAESWRRDFWQFVRDVGAPPSPRHQLERVDNDGNYEPGNVVFATASQQARNRRSTKRITRNGETLSMIEWAERFGIPPDCLRQRLAVGWDLERALTTPSQRPA